jgi:carbamoyltransferase
MYVLALHLGHNATVGLLKDGKVISCTSEERFNRKKNYLGWPTKAIAWTLHEQQITAQDLSLVVIAGQDMHGHALALNNPEVFLASNKPQVQRTLRNQVYDFAKRRMLNAVVWKPYSGMRRAKQFVTKFSMKQKLLVEFERLLAIDAKKIVFIDHHYAHAASTVFGLQKKTLVLTLDAEGDHLCSTVNIFDGNMRRIAKTRKDHSMGWLYFHITKFLGMKGNEHEFKVMGLAPYAKDEHVDKVYQELKKILYLNPKNRLEFKSSFPLQFADIYLRDHFSGTRFDNVAGGVQKLCEELIVAWVKEAIKTTGITDVAVSGGVFMNVKASQRVAQIPELTSLYVMPSAGDESLVFGCMWHGHQMLSKEPITPLKDLYLGASWTDEEIEAYLTNCGAKKRYKVRKFENIEEEIARLLANGEVVARMNGRAEWGARALGNRSILANPSNFETVKHINEMIKNRDFWMPFTPSMLSLEQKRYIINPKKIEPYYMCITFDSTPLAQEHLKAAMHPYDKTIRPQAVLQEWNPSYYAIISAFKKKTGIGAVLNTSLNLHGEPNVNSPADAIHTLDNSGLKHLAIGKFLVQKK